MSLGTSQDTGVVVVGVGDGQIHADDVGFFVGAPIFATTSSCAPGLGFQMVGPGWRCEWFLRRGPLQKTGSGSR